MRPGQTAGVDIRFVGSGDAFGTGGRFQTCIRLQADGFTALVDCGATSLTAMKAQELDPGEVDTVVISHLHADHFGGLPFLILDGQFSRREKPLTVIGPAGTQARLHTTMEACYPGSASAARRFDVRVLELDGAGTPQETGPARVTGWEVDHASGAPALAVQVNLAGAIFGYSGDTAWTPALLDAARGTDLFACEAYTYDRNVRYHLDYAAVLTHACSLAAARLILTHLGPGMLSRADEAAHQVAYDGLAVRI